MMEQAGTIDIDLQVSEHGKRFILSFWVFNNHAAVDVQIWSPFPLVSVNFLVGCLMVHIYHVPYPPFILTPSLLHDYPSTSLSTPPSHPPFSESATESYNHLRFKSLVACTTVKNHRLHSATRMMPTPNAFQSTCLNTANHSGMAPYTRRVVPRRMVVMRRVRASAALKGGLLFEDV